MARGQPYHVSNSIHFTLLKPLLLLFLNILELWPGPVFTKILILRISLILRICFKLKCNSKKHSKNLCEYRPRALIICK